MSAHLPEHGDLCAAFALGCLDASDRAEFESHLADGCVTCEAKVVHFAGAAALLAASAPEQSPSAGLRARVLDAARAVAPVRPIHDAVVAAAVETRVHAGPTRRRMAWVGWAAAAALALVAALAWRSTSLLDAELTATRARLGGELLTLRTELGQTRAQVQEQEQWLEILNAPEARVAQIALTPDGAVALRGRATYDPRSRAAVFVFANVTTPEGRDYQLWAMRPDGVSSLGLIHADATGAALIRIDDAGDPTSLAGFAVSLEPAGGSPNASAPTGPVVMVGQLGA